MTTESLGLPYRNVLGIVFGNVSEGITALKLCRINLVILLFVMVFLAGE